MAAAQTKRWATHKANGHNGNGHVPTKSLNQALAGEPFEQENELVQMARVLELYAKLAPAAQLYVHNRIV